MQDKPHYPVKLVIHFNITFSSNVFFSIIQVFIYLFSNKRKQIICIPLRGKTPNLSLPTTPSPATASVLAESPSVRMSVQLEESFVPASLASSNLGIPGK